ncbi:MAG: FHA domain-containing protein [Phycisphaerae bacterium]
MQVALVMFRPNGQRRSFPLQRDVTVVGRREDCEFRIPLGEVSRKHCQIVSEDGTLRVEDLGSSNGTFVNGHRVQESELEAGDTLQIGPLLFVLQVDGKPDEGDMEPKPAGGFAGRATPASDALNPTAASEVGEHPEPAGTRLDAEDFDPMTVLSDMNDSGEIASPVMEDVDEDDDVDDVLIDMDENDRK